MKDLTDEQIEHIAATEIPSWVTDSKVKRFARAAIAADRALNAPADRDVMRQAVTALECARDGLLWYQDLHPEDHSGADDEMHTLIDGAIAMLAAADRALNAPVDRDVMREALEAIVEAHQGFCEHHIHVQAHSSELADIASRALAAAPSPPAEQQGEQEPAHDRQCATNYFPHVKCDCSAKALATLRAEVEGLRRYPMYGGGHAVRLYSVLALFDRAMRGFRGGLIPFCTLL